MSGLDLIIKSETEGLDTLEEAIALVAFLITTGLVNSTGSYQRYCASVRDQYPDELSLSVKAWSS